MKHHEDELQFLSPHYADLGELRPKPMTLDADKMSELGLGNDGPVVVSAVMRYTAGCIKRERERIAKVFAREESTRHLVAAILDDSLDDFVFKWNGPEQTLDSSPISADDRAANKAYEPPKQ